MQENTASEDDGTVPKNPNRDETFRQACEFQSGPNRTYTTTNKQGSNSKQHAMSLPPFADPTLKVTWVLSKLDEILRMDAAGRVGRMGTKPDNPLADNPHAETIRQAMLAMRSEIAADPILDVTVSNMSIFNTHKCVQPNEECKVHR